MRFVELLKTRIRWGLENVDALAWPNAPVTRSQYVEGLARPSGSYVEGVDNLDALAEFMRAADTLLLNNIEAVELSEDMMPPGTFQEGNRYFLATIPPQYKAFQAAVPVAALPEELLPTIRIVKGSHGYELQSAALKPMPTSTFIVIADNDGLVTWFPGKLCSPVDLSFATVKQLR